MSELSVGTFRVRGIRAEEWQAVRELRLEALRDPVASVAFVETYEKAVVEPDAYWQARARKAADDEGDVRQFVAESADGSWVGSVTVLIEGAGTTDWAGFPVDRRQGHLVGVYVRPDWRGGAVARALFDAALAWAWGRGVEAVRLIVHEDNPRAQRFYRKAGFRHSGKVVPMVGRPGENEFEFVRERPRRAPSQ